MSFKQGQGISGGKVSGSHDVCSPDLKDSPEEKKTFINLLDKWIKRNENEIPEE